MEPKQQDSSEQNLPELDYAEFHSDIYPTLTPGRWVVVERFGEKISALMIEEPFGVILRRDLFYPLGIRGTSGDADHSSPSSDKT